MCVQIEDAQQSQVGWLFGRGGALLVLSLPLLGHLCRFFSALLCSVLPVHAVRKTVMFMASFAHL